MTELTHSYDPGLLDINSSNILVPPKGTGPCSQGEQRLVEAFRDEAFVVVNGLMLMKGAGETRAIPIHQVELPGGVVEAGAWYDIDYYYGREDEWYKRGAIRQAFINGDTHINFPGVTKWFRLRDVRVDQVCPGENLMLKTQQAAEKLRPGRPMPGGISRKDYLNRYVLFPEP